MEKIKIQCPRQVGQVCHVKDGATLFEPIEDHLGGVITTHHVIVGTVVSYTKASLTEGILVFIEHFRWDKTRLGSVL